MVRPTDASVLPERQKRLDTHRQGGRNGNKPHPVQRHPAVSFLGQGLRGAAGSVVDDHSDDGRPEVQQGRDRHAGWRRYSEFESQSRTMDSDARPSDGWVKAYRQFNVKPEKLLEL